MVNHSENQKPNAGSTFCATVVDEWSRSGVRSAFVAPGSRSTPLAVALYDHPRVDVQIFHDERAAGFAALGWGRSTGWPAIVCCTSGTAAAHFYASILEADLSAVPLIVCTADRPIELNDVWAPQTVDQTKMFGSAVRRFTQPGPPELDQCDWWRSWASHVVADAAGWSGQPGPVHANLAFREPFVGPLAALPAGRPDGAPWHRVQRFTRAASEATIDELWSMIQSAKCGLLLAGANTGKPQAVIDLGATLGWPVVSDHRSRATSVGQTIRHGDLLFRNNRFVEKNQPDIVLRFGEILTSKALSQWLGSLTVPVVAIVPEQRWIDPERTTTLIVEDQNIAADLVAKAEASPCQTNGDFLRRWLDADARATSVVTEIVDRDHPTSEIAIARSVLANCPPQSSLIVASSRPVRDIEWFGQSRSDVTVIANRGANGIDGTIATAIGVAATGVPTTVLLGDIAFLHDSTALIGLHDRNVDLHIVVIDNDGGGIFSFLPQAKALPPPTFETLFGTPHATDLLALADAYGLKTKPWPPHPDAGTAGRGVDVTIARTDRNQTKDLHDLIIATFNKTLDSLQKDHYDDPRF